MKTKLIHTFRNLYSNLFMYLRKIHMKRVVYRQKTVNSKARVLTKSQINEAKSFYKDYQKISDVYHNFYTEKTGEFHANYITDDIYFNVINHHFNDFNAFKIVDNKTNYDKLFPTIHQPVILATRKNGFWYIGDNIVACEEVIALLKKEPCVFVKRAADCGGASGVFYLENQSDEQLAKDFNDIVSKIPTDIAIQRRILQHPDIALLNPNAVNTMRILTVLHKDGSVKVYSSLLRIGGGKGHVDNYCSGGVAVGIDDDGKLREYGYFLNGDRVTTHPVSGKAFLGYQIPSFEEAKELVRKAHLFVPHFRMVSWDVAVEEDGTPILIETNLSDGQLDLHQLTNGPLFKEDTKKILDEVFGK